MYCLVLFCVPFGANVECTVWCCFVYRLVLMLSVQFGAKVELLFGAKVEFTVWC